MRSKQYLLKKLYYHEDKVNHYYEQIKAIEDKQRLIGFRTKNDNRVSTDGESVTFPSLTVIER